MYTYIYIIIYIYIYDALDIYNYINIGRYISQHTRHFCPLFPVGAGPASGGRHVAHVAHVAGERPRGDAAARHGLAGPSQGGEASHDIGGIHRGKPTKNDKTWKFTKKNGRNIDFAECFWLIFQKSTTWGIFYRNMRYFLGVPEALAMGKNGM